MPCPYFTSQYQTSVDISKYHVKFYFDINWNGIDVKMEFNIFVVLIRDFLLNILEVQIYIFQKYSTLGMEKKF